MSVTDFTYAWAHSTIRGFSTLPALDQLVFSWNFIRFNFDPSAGPPSPFTYILSSQCIVSAKNASVSTFPLPRLLPLPFPSLQASVSYGIKTSARWTVCSRSRHVFVRRRSNIFCGGCYQGGNHIFPFIYLTYLYLYCVSYAIFSCEILRFLRHLVAIRVQFPLFSFTVLTGSPPSPFTFNRQTIR